MELPATVQYEGEQNKFAIEFELRWTKSEWDEPQLCHIFCITNNQL